MLWVRMVLQQCLRYELLTYPIRFRLRVLLKLTDPMLANALALVTVPETVLVVLSATR